MHKRILTSIAAHIKAAVTSRSSPPRKPGRPPFARSSMLCAFVFKALLGIRSEKALHRALHRDPVFRDLCAFYQVPSLRTLNRFRARRHRLIDAVFQKLVARFAEIHDLGIHLVVDSPPIPVSPKDSDTRTGYGTRGWFYGYKLHLLASCETKLPLRAVLTRGNRHDAPLLPRLLQRPLHLADRFLLADAGYDSEENVAQIWESGATPLVQLNKRRGGKTSTTRFQWHQGFQVGGKNWLQHFRWRNQVEGIFGRLKTEFLIDGILVQGFRNVKFYLFTYLCAMIVHAVVCVELGQEPLMLRIWEVFQ